MVYHSVVLDVNKGTSSCVLDILEKDKNSHQLLIKLVCCGSYYNISGYTPAIEFFDNTTKTVVLTTAVEIINSYRGYMSYILGERILMHPSRYTVFLKLYGEDCGSSKLSASFILNVVKDSTSGGCGCPPPCEVIITKEFYDQLKSHLDNTLIHVSESDRAILTYLTDNLDQLVLKKDLESINEQVDSLARSVESYDSVIKELQDSVSSYDDRIQSLEDSVSGLRTGLEWKDLQ